MSSEQTQQDLTWEQKQEQARLKQLERKTKGNIDINDRTIKAYREELRKKGLQPEESDYPRDDYINIGYVRNFDNSVDPSKGITKQIVSMVRQAVSVNEIQKDGTTKRVVKDAVYFNGWYRGFTYAEVPIACEFHEGSYRKPILAFQLTDTGNPFDPRTGEKKGQYGIVREVFEHYLFVPEEKKARRKYLEDLISQYPNTVPEELGNGYLSYRQANSQNNHNSQHGGSFTWDQFCDLSLEQLGELQRKGYYEENGITRDKDGKRVEWNRGTGKLEAIR